MFHVKHGKENDEHNKRKMIIIYYKWVKRVCPHFCFMCRFKHQNKGVCSSEIFLDALLDMLDKQMNKRER